MKKRHGLLIGFAVMLIAAIFTLTGCPMDADDDDGVIDIPGVGIASDGSGAWWYDPDYGRFEISKTTMPNSPLPGVEVIRIKDAWNPITTLDFNYGEGLFIRMYTKEGGTKTIDDKTISTDARDNYYFMTLSSLDYEIGAKTGTLSPDLLISAGMLDKKLMSLKSATTYNFFGYDTGGGKIPACGHPDDAPYEHLYLYVVAELFDSAYERQTNEKSNTESNYKTAPVDYPDKYFDDNNGNGFPDTNSRIQAFEDPPGTHNYTTPAQRIIAKFPIKMSKTALHLQWMIDGVNAVTNSASVSVSETLSLGVHSQMKSTWGFDAGSFVKHSYSYTSSNPDVITVSSSGLVTAKGAGTAFVTVTAAAQIEGLHDEAKSIFTVTVTN